MGDRFPIVGVIGLEIKKNRISSLYKSINFQHSLIGLFDIENVRCIYKHIILKSSFKYYDVWVILFCYAAKKSVACTELLPLNGHWAHNIALMGYSSLNSVNFNLCNIEV